MTNKYINVTVSGNDLKKVSVNKTQANHTINASADLSVYYSNRAREWAISDKLVDNEDFSSKYYSQKSKQYAENGEKQIAQVLETSSNAMVEIENNKDLALSNIETKTSEAVEIAINEVTAQELKSINNITDTAEAETSKSITSIQEALEEELQKIPNIDDLVTQTDLNTAIASIPQFKLSIVSKLPATGEKLVLYLIPKTGSNNDVYNEYIWIENTNTFEFIGTTAVDLTNYATKEELEDKADNSTVVHKDETEVITGLKTFTQPLKIQNGAGTGSLIIGGDVNSGTLTNGVRKLARVAVPTQANVDLFATLLGFDSNGDDALHIKNKNYDAISFGGQTKITNATSPMSINFCVAKTRNGTNANDKIYTLEMDSSEARFNVQPNYNGVNLATTNDIPDVSNKAPISSPAFTGTPTSTTPDTSDNSTKIATTAFVKNVVANLSGGENNSSSGGGFEIGDIGIAPLGIDESKGKRRYLNGQIIIQEQYAGFTKKVKDAINLYPSLACSEDEWQATALLTVGGQVGKFVVDDDAGTIRLPKIIMPIQGLTDLSKLAEIVEAGLPNLYGQFGTGQNEYFDGVLFTQSDNIRDDTAEGGSSDTSAIFDASKYNPIYGNSDTVQQEQIQYPYFIQVATGAETKDEITNEHELVNPYVLLEPKFFETPVYNLSWLISNGSFTGSKAVHPHAYDALLIELNADIEVGITQNNYTKRGLPVKLVTDSYTDYDFVVNPADETFRPPLKVNLASSKAVVGNGMTIGLDGGDTLVESGLAFTGANATGFTARYSQLQQPVGTESTNTTQWVGSAGNSKHYGIGLSTDPTKSGLELADSNLYLYFYVGEVAQNINLVNAGRIEEKIANLITVVETYQNDTSWYVLYSNGWCMQGGTHIPTTSASTVTINLLKPYINTNYSVLRTNITSNSSNTNYRAEGVSNITTNSFDMYAPNVSTVSKVVWEAKGYIA